ncbi:MAG: urease accessory protein UreE [Candidatus Rokuibacteriota bacterium]|nr:MAG: urease accessory protein UreE [Candidatus Rokubacteria bacterium]
MGGPEMAPHTPPPPSRSSQGLDRPRDATPVITEIDIHVDANALRGLERDVLVLTAEERRWGRRRVKTAAGRELILALPTGTALTPGHVLHRDADWYVVIDAAAEPVLAITPRSRDEALRVAFEVGNRHFTLAIDGDRLLVPDDTAMEQLLTRLNVPWKRDHTVFVPVGAGHRHD